MAGVADAPADAAESGSLAGPPRRYPPLKLRHVATLLWMRWKLTLRGYVRGGAASIVGLVFLLLFLVPLVGGLAFGTTFGYLNLPRGAAVQLLFAVLGVLYVFWAALPLLQYTLNEGLDVTRLQIYPVSRAEMMAGLILATFMDVGTLVLVGLYVPVLIGWSPTPAAATVTVAALALAYVHTVGLSQLLLAALMGLLRSRRYRDVSIIVFALLGATCSVLGQFIAPLLRITDPQQLAQIRLDIYLQYSPPGMAARAIELAARGEYLPALAWLGGLALLAPLLLVIWARVLEHGITAAETAGGAPPRRARRGAARRIPESSGAGAAAVAGPAAKNGAATLAATHRWLPLSRAARAVAAKDARYLWRDPQLKASLLSSLFVLVFVLLPSFSSLGSREGIVILPIQVLYAPIPTLIVALNLSLNSLGLERQGLQMLFLFPVRPLDVLWGKNLTVGSITFGAQVVLAVALAAISGGWGYVPVALATGLAGVLVLMACGNVSSVLLPFRVRELRMGRSSLSSENGCLRAVLSMLTLLIAAVLLTPVGLALGIPLLAGQNAWLAISLPLALVYGVGLHQLVTRLIAPQMLARAPEILAVTVRE
jgi:ABC-2 type transport system permease protein